MSACVIPASSVGARAVCGCSCLQRPQTQSVCRLAFSRKWVVQRALGAEGQGAGRDACRARARAASGCAACSHGL